MLLFFLLREAWKEASYRLDNLLERTRVHFVCVHVSLQNVVHTFHCFGSLKKNQKIYNLFFFCFVSFSPFFFKSQLSFSTSVTCNPPLPVRMSRWKDFFQNANVKMHSSESRCYRTIKYTVCWSVCMHLSSRKFGSEGVNVLSTTKNTQDNKK